MTRQDKCHTCKHASAMPDLKLHVYCSVDGAVQGSFTPACNDYIENKQPREIGFFLRKTLEKKKERGKREDSD